MNNLEIEIQVRPERIEPLTEFLKQNGEFVSEHHQIDDYFVPPHRDFLKERPLREWLRLRDADGAYSINYKNWHYDENGKSLHWADEFESPIENIEVFRKIFNALNFRHIVTVDKKRQIWMYKDCEVAIDNIRGLGDYVEVEYKGASSEAKEKIVADMIAFLRNAGCGTLKVGNDGYPFQLLFPNEASFEIIR